MHRKHQGNDYSVKGDRGRCFCVRIMRQWVRLMSRRLGDTAYHVTISPDSSMRIPLTRTRMKKTSSLLAASSRSCYGPASASRIEALMTCAP